MLAPLVPPVVKPGDAMPWKVDRSKYQLAIEPPVKNRPAIVNPAPIQQKTLEAPTVRHAAGQERDNAQSSVQPAAAQMAAPMQGQMPNGFSSAGVPLYASHPEQANRSTAPQAHVASAASKFQGSDTRNAIGSGIQSAPMQTGDFMAPPSMPAPPVISPGSEMIMGDPGQSTVNPQPGTMPSVINDGSVAMPETTFSESGYVADSVVSGGGCDTCNTSGAAGCESGGDCNCGPGGCYNAADIASKAGLYGSVGEARNYAHLEALLYTRTDDAITLSTIGDLGDFEFDAGWRVTLGERFDAINGREISYSGTADISESSSFTGSILPTFSSTDLADAVQPFGVSFPGIPAQPFVPGTPAQVIDGINIPAVPPMPATPGVAPQDFFASEQSQSIETSFHSLEFNKVRWGWDVFKSFAGIRYIYMDDRYRLDSTNPNLVDNQSATFQLYTQNNLIGPHAGAEWFYDVGYRLSFSLGFKGGVYANLNEVDTRLIRTGATVLDNDDENTSFATSLDGNFIAHYQISPRGRLRVGYNAMYLGDVATVTDNQPTGALSTNPFGGISPADNPRQLSAASGTNASDSDYVTFHGFSFGLEFFR